MNTPNSALMKKIFAILRSIACFVILGSSVSSAQVPATDVFLAKVRYEPIRIDSVKNATKRPGYDNQPSFASDGKSILFTSIREDNQADIYRYDLPSETIARIVATSESEYSPVRMLDEGISVVRVEKDSTQRLWRFDAEGKNPRLILSGIKNVGYYVWTDAKTVALFVIGTPITLQLADIASGTSVVAGENIGRSLHLIPGQRAMSFVHKASKEEWWITKLDLETRSTIPIARTLEGKEDHCWLPDGSLIMGRASSLYVWRSGEWEEIANFSSILGDITRLAVSPDGVHLAIVGIPVQVK
jgi:hypothetical protein